MNPLFLGIKIKNKPKGLFTMNAHCINQESPAIAGLSMKTKKNYKAFIVVVEVTLVEEGKSCPIAVTVPEASPVVVLD